MADLRIQVDVWGGDMHQRLVQEHIVSDWKEVARITEEACEVGLLVNVLCLDFKVPPERYEEQRRAMASALSDHGRNP